MGNATRIVITQISSEFPKTDVNACKKAFTLAQHLIKELSFTGIKHFYDEYSLAFCLNTTWPKNGTLSFGWKEKGVSLCLTYEKNGSKEVFAVIEEQPIYVGLKFKSFWFLCVKHIEVLEIKEAENILKVKITRSAEHWHFEDWNLEHTRWGFKTREYTEISDGSDQ